MIQIIAKTSCNTNSCKTSSNPVLLRRFPYPPFYNDPLLFGLELLGPEFENDEEDNDDT
uniref:Uncharacterized protein n=1 Tax=Anopheles albimanus TaxID=7167 RepID=A0A182FYG0_ANOAL